MQRETWQLLKLCLVGFAIVFGQVALVAILIFWTLQALAMLHGLTFDWLPILQHLFLSLSFLAFYPGQKFWTVQLRGPDGRIYTIVGRDEIPGTSLD